MLSAVFTMSHTHARRTSAPDALAAQSLLAHRAVNRKLSHYGATTCRCTSGQPEAGLSYRRHCLTWRSSSYTGQVSRQCRCRADHTAREGTNNMRGLRSAGPSDEPPDYATLDSQPFNRMIMALFRSKMAAALREDVPSQGYQGIVDLTRILNARFDSPGRTQEVTQGILKSLFPAWLLPAFRVMFSKPLPRLSCRMNAAVTALTCQWLMGPCAVNDAEDSKGASLPRQGVLIDRCRYLEETQCASICINSCKMPTQEFFKVHMGLPLTMEPNYDDFSCQFSFGREPPAPDKDEAFSTACFMDCPSKQPHSQIASQCAGCQPAAGALPIN